MFLRVTVADSNDWEAHEKLALLYQWEGRRTERNLELEYLRSMARRGLAWRNFILRDQFVFDGMRIVTAETLTGSLRGKRKFLFSITDLATGKFLHIISMIRTEQVSFSANSSPIDKKALLSGFSYTVQCESQTRTYFLAGFETRYSDSKRILMKFLEGL
ncbi:MAG TPA: hypothetical protein VJ385_14165 [Fibrobacteria bacterium]|nr:hypothetical protein [Fibrobacteria bacterium]